MRKVNEGLSSANDAIREQFPEQHKAVVVFTEPYLNLGKDLGKIGWNICGNIKEVIVEKYPSVRQSVSFNNLYVSLFG